MSEIAWFRQFRLCFSITNGIANGGVVVMKWVLVTIGSLATGASTLFLALVLLVVSLRFYMTHVLGFGPNESVGWDVVSLFGPHWKVAVIGIPLLTFGLGFSVGFWFFAR